MHFEGLRVGGSFGEHTMDRGGHKKTGQTRRRLWPQKNVSDKLKSNPKQWKTSESTTMWYVCMLWPFAFFYLTTKIALLLLLLLAFISFLYWNGTPTVRECVCVCWCSSATQDRRWWWWCYWRWLVVVVVLLWLMMVGMCVQCWTKKRPLTFDAASRWWWRSLDLRPCGFYIKKNTRRRYFFWSMFWSRFIQ